MASRKILCSAVPRARSGIPGSVAVIRGIHGRCFVERDARAGGGGGDAAAVVAVAAAAMAAAAAASVATYDGDGAPSGRSSAVAGHFLSCRESVWTAAGSLRPRLPRGATACEGRISPSRSHTPPSPTSSVESPLSPQPLSVRQRFLYRVGLLRHSSLPLPRRLDPLDPAFEYPQLRRGLRRRIADEARLRAFSAGEASEARRSGDNERMRRAFVRMSELAYGAGVSPQDREDFLARYGCAGHTDEILKYLAKDVGGGGGDGGSAFRGILEIGAGNGQWARALSDAHSRLRPAALPPRDFVLAYDSMTDLPLSPKIYHRHTAPARDYFYDKVRTCESHMDAAGGYMARGRTLLLVYPPPGSMALETVRAYADADGRNDTVAFVGEGRGGANADGAFFDYFLGATDGGDGWILLNVMDVRPSPGGKGYEKMFVFRRVASPPPSPANKTDN